MNNRRNFLAAGGALAAISALPKAKADEQRAYSIYLHGMVWNRQLLAPMNDWLVRLDAKADVPIGDDSWRWSLALPRSATISMTPPQVRTSRHASREFPNGTSGRSMYFGST